MRTTRREAWKKLVWRRGVFLIGLVTLFLSSVTFWWDELFPDLRRPHLATIIHATHWWYLVILGLGAIVVLVVEGALSLVNGKEESLELEQLKNQQPEIKGEIIVVFAWTGKSLVGRPILADVQFAVLVKLVNHRDVATTIDRYELKLKVGEEYRTAVGEPFVSTAKIAHRSDYRDRSTGIALLMASG
jgi:hypothetical protein